MKGVVLRIVLAVLIVLSVATARQFAIGSRSMLASDEAMARGDTPAAIDEARGAAEARAPMSPYPARGFERLAALAHTAEKNGNFADSARAWRAVRSAVLATRADDGDGDDEHLREANVQIARIGARPRPEVGGAAGDSLTSASVEAHLREDLTRNEHPGASAYAALGAGALLFYLGIASLLGGAAKRWPTSWSAGLVAAGALLATVGCLLS